MGLGEKAKLGCRYFFRTKKIQISHVNRNANGHDKVAAFDFRDGAQVILQEEISRQHRKELVCLCVNLLEVGKAAAPEVKGEQGAAKANDMHSKERMRASRHFLALYLQHFDSECEVKDCDFV
jgi:hypothetical protein